MESEGAASELERLERLRSAGTITQGEFEALKAKVVGLSTASAPVKHAIEGMELGPGQIAGYSGSLLLILGCFAPLVHLPIVGSINYIFNGRGDGMIVLGLSILSVVLIFLEKHRALAFTTLGIGAVCSFTFVNFAMMFANLRSSVDTSLHDNPFRGFADVMVSAIGLDWAWALLVLGIALLLSSSILGSRQNSAV